MIPKVAFVIQLLRVRVTYRDCNKDQLVCKMVNRISVYASQRRVVLQREDLTLYYLSNPKMEYGRRALNSTTYPTNSPPPLSDHLVLSKRSLKHQRICNPYVSVIEVMCRHGPTVRRGPKSDPNLAGMPS